jgi:hypothetical protein
MKYIFWITALFLFLDISCNQSNKQESNSAEILPVQEEAQIQPQNFLIQEKQCGPFRIGDPIPFPRFPEPFKVKRLGIYRNTEEGRALETTYIASDSTGELLVIYPEITETYGSSSNTIGEMDVISSKFSTREGISVGSTIEDFRKVYKNQSFWYTYISNMYVLETEDYPSIQFLLDEHDFKGSLKISDEVEKLRKKDFPPEAKIIKIRLL